MENHRVPTNEHNLAKSKIKKIELEFQNDRKNFSLINDSAYTILTNDGYYLLDLDGNVLHSKPCYHYFNWSEHQDTFNDYNLLSEGDYIKQNINILRYVQPDRLFVTKSLYGGEIRQRAIDNKLKSIFNNYIIGSVEEQKLNNEVDIKNFIDESKTIFNDILKEKKVEFDKVEDINYTDKYINDQENAIRENKEWDLNKERKAKRQIVEEYLNC